MKITKEQVLELKDHCTHGESGIVRTKLEQWFPEAFEVKLEVGKWYKGTSTKNCEVNKSLFCIVKTDMNDVCAYGFDFNGAWTDEKSGFSNIKNHSNVIATDQEVESAFIAEAKKRGFKEGVWFKLKDKPMCEAKGRLEYQCDDKLAFVNSGWVIYYKGVWAEIIPTMSIKEAEEKLNCKIIL